MARKRTLRLNAAALGPTVEPLTLEQLDLVSLADKINAAHLEVELSLRRALQAAYEAGEALREAKCHLGHGEFLPWLQENCQCSIRTAQRYMAIAEYWDALAAKCDSVTHLKLQDAYRLIAEIRRGEVPELPPAQSALQEYHRMASKLLAKTEGLSSLIGLPAPTEELQRLQQELATVLQRIKEAIATLPD